MNRFRKSTRGKAVTPDTLPIMGIAFLLLLFFLFIQQSNRFRMMEMQMPVECCCESVYGCDWPDYSTIVLNILVDSTNRYYTYMGLGNDPMSPPQLDVSTSIKELRGFINQKKTDIQNKIQKGALSPRFTLVCNIKPTDHSTYGNFVEVLDEMEINRIRVYTCMDISAVEQGFIDETKKANSWL